MIAILSHPAEANAFAVAAPMPAKPLFFAFSFPAIDFYEGIPVPPAPVTTATPGKVQVCVISAGDYYREQEN